MLILNPSCATKALIQNAAQHVSSSTSQNEPLLLCSSLCTGYLSHEGQGIDACLQIYHRLSSPLLSFAPSPRPHQKPTISQWATARGTITESLKKKKNLSPEHSHSRFLMILTLTWNAESLTTFKRQLKTHLFRAALNLI